MLRIQKWLRTKVFSYNANLFDKSAPAKEMDLKLWPFYLYLITNHIYQQMSLLCSHWLYDLCRGIEFEAVKPRQLPKSIGCSKNFPGKTSLATKEQVQPIALCFPCVLPGFEKYCSNCLLVLVSFWLKLIKNLVNVVELAWDTFTVILLTQFSIFYTIPFMICKNVFMLFINDLCVGTVLASSTGPWAGGEADQGPRSGEKKSCVVV